MPAGRPPVFNTVEEIQQSIDNYFKDGVKIKTVLIGKPPNQQAPQSWLNMNDVPEETVMHELGHAILKRGHYYDTFERWKV